MVLGTTGLSQLRRGALEYCVLSLLKEGPRYGFELGRDDLIAMTNREEEFDIAIYHSHPRSEAAPSQQDRNVMQGWPGYLQVIVSATHEPAIRAWWIADGRVEEEPVEVA